MIQEKIEKGYFEGDGNPFKVPPGYFKESRAGIMDAIGKEVDAVPGRKINMRARIIWASGIAASLLIGVLLFNSFYLRPQQEIRIAEEIEWFIEYSGSDLNTLALASYASEEGFSFENTDNDYVEEQSNLLELTEYDELFIIEEWMKEEN